MKIDFLVSRVDETPPTNEGAIKSLFLPFISNYGETRFHGSMIMSCGPFGANLFYRFICEVASMTALGKLLDDTREPMHGFVVAVMRNNWGKVGTPSDRLSSMLSFADEGELHSGLDDDYPFETAIVSEWDNLCSKVADLEAENLVLRARLQHYTIDPK